MGSALYKIRIEKIEQAEVKCKVFIIHPDVCDIPETKTFAMNIILECWRNMLDGYFFPNESHLPISEEKAKNLAEKTSFYQIFESLERLSFSYKEFVTKDEYEKAEKGILIYKGIRISGYGFDGAEKDRKYYIMMPENYDDFEKEVEKYIVFVKLINQINFPWPKWPKNLSKYEEAEFYEKYYDLKNVPQADFSFTVNDPKMLNFLVPKTEWETAIWH